MSKLVYEIGEAGYGPDKHVPYLKPLHIGDNIYIFGHQFGVAIKKRGESDNSVLCELLTEDDGNWYSDFETKFDAYWIKDMRELITHVQKYLHTSALFTVRQTDGRGFEYKFREKQA